LAAAWLKNPAFKAEDEWRLILFEPYGGGVPPEGAGVKIPTLFRSTVDRIVPYKEITYGALPLREIVLGASADIQPQDRALEVLVNEAIGNQVPVRISDVPVRP